MEIIVKRYEHYNSALGKYIRTKQEYDYEMKTRGFISQEQGNRLAESKKKEMTWVPSKDVVNMLREIKTQKDKDGNFKPSTRMQEGMKKLGMGKEPKFMPKGLEGGFHTE
jgi:hypothetical protein